MFYIRRALIIEGPSTMTAQRKGLCEKTQDKGRKWGGKLSGLLGASCLKCSTLRL